MASEIEIKARASIDLVRVDDGSDGKPGSDGKDGTMLYGTCVTGSSMTNKIANVSDFKLYSGVTVSIKFAYKNTASSPTLNVNSTGAKPINVNGSRYAYWEDGATVNFVYDGLNWNVCSIPVYANEVTVGNPSGSNIHIDSTGVKIKNGSTVDTSFTSERIELGKNSINSEILACGDAVSIKAKKSANNRSALVTIQSNSPDILFANHSSLTLHANASGADSLIHILSSDSLYQDNPYGGNYGLVIIKATHFGLDAGNQMVPLHDSEGYLTLVDASSRDSSFRPRWVMRGGWVQLQGRVKTTKSNAIICDLKSIIDPRDIPPYGVNRNFACFTNIGSATTNVFINSSGQLTASNQLDMIDISVISFRAKPEKPVVVA